MLDKLQIYRQLDINISRLAMLLATGWAIVIRLHKQTIILIPYDWNKYRCFAKQNICKTEMHADLSMS